MLDAGCLENLNISQNLTVIKEMSGIFRVKKLSVTAVYCSRHSTRDIFDCAFSGVLSCQGNTGEFHSCASTADWSTVIV